MLLLMASACSLTLIVLSISAMEKLFKAWVTRSQNSAKVSCVICWSNSSRWNSRFLANLLDRDIRLVRPKRNVCLLLYTQSARNSQTFTIGYLNQERHTSWFSCHQLLCCHLFSINYLLFCEMYEIYREQIYVPALNAQKRLFQSNTVATPLKMHCFPENKLNCNISICEDFGKLKRFQSKKIWTPDLQTCYMEVISVIQQLGN